MKDFVLWFVRPEVRYIYKSAIHAKKHVDVMFWDFLKEQYKDIKPRFSAGYGDFPLSAQKEIFGMLDCARQIGLTLNDSLLMSPTKSVTSIVGLE